MQLEEETLPEQFKFEYSQEEETDPDKMGFLRKMQYKEEQEQKAIQQLKDK